MKRHRQERRWLLPLAATALLMSGCANFKPVEDAATGPYHAPPDEKSAVFAGMPNEKQVAHMQSATFPRLTDGERSLLRRVNRQVNEQITYLSDEDNYGCMDFPVVEPSLHHPVAWGLPTARYGDCKDYALTKKKRIAERGMPPSRLFVVRAKVPTDEGPKRHVVLAVPEGSDWWILNNWDNRIEAASHLAKWWGWDFDWPRFDDYRRIAKARTGVQYAARGWHAPHVGPVRL